MNTLLKMILVTTPVIFFLLFYVVTKQNKMDYEMIKEDLKFEEEWNRMGWEVKRDPFFLEAEKRAEEKLAEVEKKEKRKREKLDRLEESFDEVLKDPYFEKNKDKNKVFEVQER